MLLNPRFSMRFLAKLPSCMVTRMLQPNIIINIRILHPLDRYIEGSSANVMS